MYCVFVSQSETNSNHSHSTTCTSSQTPWDFYRFCARLLSCSFIITTFEKAVSSNACVLCAVVFIHSNFFSLGSAFSVDPSSRCAEEQWTTTQWTVQLSTQLLALLPPPRLKIITKAIIGGSTIHACVSVR